MTARKRAAKELEALQEELPSYLRDLNSENSNVLVWNALLLPDQEPYNLRAFKFRITFPQNYPFSPPQLNFITKIYHPNVTEDGEVCLPLLQSWTARTKIREVLKALIDLVNTLKEGLPLRPDLANMYFKNRSQFMKDAEKFTLKFGEDRPVSQ
ncbi:ubiquitin/ISG15-conjugating enzyme E2 L6 isoform X2 [Dromiciops gliroides]|uniref:ubiquitin/ISG15-conjugating enzyme E2 L6 isoform X2 n=1 Tax=Dromiciops gliroides TaxID=33562 RepID=UPI001CC3A4CA|nr:ubiquitin/ISG15-conjugating enzyme E2 L6 isoform X2 [Dromiciops gliroides]